MPKDRTLSSPNRMVWELFQALRRLCTRATEAHASQDESALRQDAAICVILAVQCVEVFFNVYFQVLLSESTYAHAAKKISADLAKKQFGLDGKIKDWPCHVFGKKLALDKGAGQKFVALKNLRHSLMHFKSSHETFSIPAKSPGSGLEFILFQCGKLRPEQIYWPRFHQLLSIKSASSPSKSCARSYEINSDIHICSSHHYGRTNRSSLALRHPDHPPTTQKQRELNPSALIK